MKKFGSFMRSTLDVMVDVAVCVGMAGVAVLAYNAVTSSKE